MMARMPPPGAAASGWGVSLTGDLAVVALFGATWAAAAGSLRHRFGALDAAAGGGVVAWVAVAGAGLALGAAGILRAGPWAGAVLLVALGLAVGAAVAGRLRPAPTPPLPFRPSPPAGAALALATAASLTVGTLAVLLPDVSWDGLAYHLPMAYHAVQDGSLRPPEAQWFAVRDLPRALDLLPAFAFAVSGGDRLVDAAQVPALLLGGLGVAALARRCGAGPSAAALAGALFPAAPAALAQAPTTYVDLTFAGLVLAGWGLAAGGTSAGAALAGTALGLACAGKATGLLMAAGAAAAITLSRPRDRLRGLAAFALPLLALAGPSWGARALRYGNPFHPLEVRLPLGLSLPGYLAPDHFRGAEVPALAALSPWARTWVGWTDLLGSEVRYDMAPGGFGPAWPLLVLPGALAALALARGAGRRPSLALGAAAPFVLLFPALGFARYSLAIWGAGLAAGAVGLTALRAVRPRAAALAAWGAVALQAVGAWSARWPVVVPRDVLASALAEGRLPSFADAYPWDGPHGERALFRFLADRAAGGTTAYTDTSPSPHDFLFTAPLWCGDPSHRVAYVPPAPRPHWLAALAATGADAVVVGRGSPPDTWLAEGGAPWTRDYQGSRFAVFTRPSPAHPPAR